MDATISIDLSRIARRFKLPPTQVEAVLRLLDEGCTPAFIARYRKDATEGLDESQIRAIRSEVTRSQQLAHRKDSVRRAIQAQSKLTDELAEKLDKARDLRHVEDLFLPFRPQKEALAAAARDRGLAPLAEEVLHGSVSSEDLETRGADFVDPDRQLKSVADVLLGVGHILAEDLGDNAALRAALRKIYRDNGRLVTKRIDSPDVAAQPNSNESPTEAATKSEEATETAAPVDETNAGNGELENSSPAESQTATDNAEGPISTTSDKTIADDGGSTEGQTAAGSGKDGEQLKEAPSANQTIPAAEPVEKAAGKSKGKGKKKQADKKAKPFTEYFNFSQPVSRIKPHQILTINRGERSGVLEVDIEVDRAKLFTVAEETVVEASHPHADFLRGCLRDAVERILPADLEREVRRDLTDKAEEHAIEVFASNLRNLLLQPPVANKRIVAIDPSFKSGCKFVAIDFEGTLLDQGVLHIVGNKERMAESRGKLVELVRQQAIDVIAIGNGTASRETEQIIANLFENEWKAEVEADRLAYLIVNKAGAADYATSQIGREELPDVDAAVRAAVFIGRRLLDPLAELVKVDPASIGVGLYQHDIKGTDLGATLSEVVESCVNHVGVDLNRASAALLRYVSGLNPLIARRLFEHRQEHGPFTSRQQLFDVTGFSDDSFTQAAGFLKIPGAENSLDAAWIHPESYDIAEKIRARLASDETGAASTAPPDAIAMSAELEVGVRLVRDIVVQLKQPGRDPREDLPAPIFRKRALQVGDLNVGMDLRATVLNVTDFGAFVDIGLKESALVHVSQISANYVSDPHKVVAVGDTVQVWIKAIDGQRGRVTLTMIHPEAERQPRGGRPRRRSSTQDGTGAKKSSARGKSSHEKGKHRNQRGRSGGPKPSGSRRERKPKPVVPITKEMLKGDEPMRTFGDLKQFIDSQGKDEQDDSSS